MRWAAFALETSEVKVARAKAQHGSGVAGDHREIFTKILKGTILFKYWFH